MGGAIIEVPVTAMELGTRVLVMGAGTQMFTGILTQTFLRMDKHTPISNPRFMGMGSPVNRLLPTQIMGTTPGLPTTLSKAQGTTSLLETANANIVNAVNAANIAIATGNVDAAIGIPDPILTAYLPPNPILTPLSPLRSPPGLKTSKMRSTHTISSRSERL